MPTKKICRVCKKEKPLNMFSLASGNKDGYNMRCKQCVAEHARNYYKTLPGLITHIYNSEKQSSHDRKHPIPAYTKKELKLWLYNHGVEEFFIVWKLSGYQKNLRPSVDRLNSIEPYTLQNIRLVTWKENNDAAYTERKTCRRITKQCRKINQLDDNHNIIATFKSIAAASRITSIQRTNINAACSGKIDHRAGGYFWKYVA